MPLVDNNNHMVDPLTTGIGAVAGSGFIAWIAKHLYTRFTSLERRVNNIERRHDVLAQQFMDQQSSITERLQDIKDDIKELQEDIKSLLRKV